MSVLLERINVSSDQLLPQYMRIVKFSKASKTAALTSFCGLEMSRKALSRPREATDFSWKGGFHAFSGCDLTSVFCVKGKRTAFSAWDSSLDKAFLEISSPQNEVSAAVFEALQNFTIRMYCGSSGSEETLILSSKTDIVATISDFSFYSCRPPPNV